MDYDFTLQRFTLFQLNFELTSGIDSYCNLATVENQQEKICSGKPSIQKRKRIQVSAEKLKCWQN